VRPGPHAPPEVPPPAAPTLDDGDVVLRAHRPGDLDGILEQCRDPDTVRFTTVPHPYGREHAAGFLTQVAQDWADGRAAAFAIEVDGRFAGTVDLRWEDGAFAEIGFGLAPWARGRGVMTRAARLALGWAFRDRGLAGAHWRAVVGNEGSLGVARACGFRLEGTVRGLLVHRGERLDGWIGTVLAEEFTAR